MRLTSANSPNISKCTRDPSYEIENKISSTARKTSLLCARASMSAEGSESKGWIKLIVGSGLRVAIYLTVFFMLYALSKGPAKYHRRSMDRGGAGYMPVLRAVYAPLERIEYLIPFYYTST
jgi:hypothetical protein